MCKTRTREAYPSALGGFSLNEFINFFEFTLERGGRLTRIICYGQLKQANKVFKGHGHLITIQCIQGMTFKRKALLYLLLNILLQGP